MKSEPLARGYEAVFTVTDYDDGPRRGVASYRGKPHFFECTFDDANDGYSDFYRLTPLDERTFNLAMEDWHIWRRWEIAFHSGKADISTYPALPSDTRRHEALKRILDGLLVTYPRKAFILIGRFDVIAEPNFPKGLLRPLRVKWIEP
jgi:hypothetical protein